MSFMNYPDWRVLQEEFARIKKVRDQYIHQKSIDDAKLPLDEAISLTVRLLRYYMLMASAVD